MAIATYTEPLKKHYQIEYVFYMMFSSYFKKVKCTSKSTEKVLLLYYKEAGQKTQYEYEDNILWAIDNVILPKLGNPNFEEDEIDVRIAKEKDNTHTLYFIGKDFILEFKLKLEMSNVIYCIKIQDKGRFSHLKSKKITCFSHLIKGKNEQPVKKNKEEVVKELDSDFE